MTCVSFGGELCSVLCRNKLKKPLSQSHNMQNTVCIDFDNTDHSIQYTWHSAQDVLHNIYLHDIHESTYNIIFIVYANIN